MWGLQVTAARPAMTDTDRDWSLGAHEGLFERGSWPDPLVLGKERNLDDALFLP